MFSLALDLRQSRDKGKIKTWAAMREKKSGGEKERERGGKKASADIRPCPHTRGHRAP